MGPHPQALIVFSWPGSFRFLFVSVFYRTIWMTKNIDSIQSFENYLTTFFQQQQKKKSFNKLVKWQETIYLTNKYFCEILCKILFFILSSGTNFDNDLIQRTDRFILPSGLNSSTIFAFRNIAFLWSSTFCSRLRAVPKIHNGPPSTLEISCKKKKKFFFNF